MSFNNYDAEHGGVGQITNEAFMSPLTPSGQVLFNGVVAEGAVIAAFNNPSPKWPLPRGATLAKVGTVRVADVVYALIDGNQYMQSQYERYSNTDVVGLSSINGQGRADQTEAQFLARVQPLGLAFMPNDENSSKRFNIHCGGLYTIMNVSNVDIVAGNWLMIYAPTPQEASEGGRGLEDDANGLVTLWLKPYFPEIHRLHPPQIYACLTRRAMGGDVHTSSDGRAYLVEYGNTCDDLFDAFLGIGVAFVKYLTEAGEVRTTRASGDMDALLSEVMQTAGHKAFYSAQYANNDVRQQLINLFFLAQVRAKTPEHEEANGFSTHKQLAEAQRRAPTMMFVSIARFLHTINKNIMGKAITSMAPKKNGNMQLCSYMCGR